MSSPPPLAAMSAAAEDVAQLLGRACTLTAELDEAHSRTPVLACLSFGAEQLVKLTLGLSAITDGDQWPHMESRVYRHNLCKLDATCRERFRTQGDDVLRQAVAGLDGDATVDDVLAAADRYGRVGRYHHLDAIGHAYRGEDVQPPDEAPAQLWDDMLNQLWSDDPELSRRFLQFPVPPDDPAQAETNGVIVRAIRRWWSTYAQAWRSGVVGPEAARWANQIEFVPWW